LILTRGDDAPTSTAGEVMVAPGRERVHQTVTVPLMQLKLIVRDGRPR
jgi:hypothetical protein